MVDTVKPPCTYECDVLNVMVQVVRETPSPVNHAPELSEMYAHRFGVGNRCYVEKSYRACAVSSVSFLVRKKSFASFTARYANTSSQGSLCVVCSRSGSPYGFKAVAMWTRMIDHPTLECTRSAISGIYILECPYTPLETGHTKPSLTYSNTLFTT